jgi:hypothetical protein
MRICFVASFFLFSSFSIAQQFSGFPPSTKWKQINTDTARIIFQPTSEEQAQRIAAIIHKMAAQNSNTLGNDLKKINIILHKNTTLANGYVALAPFRSEYYLIPSSNIFELGNLPWGEYLAVHEYRHVQQYNNFNNGLTKVFNFFLGQEGQAIANGLTIPQWFFEGDAVYAETKLTTQGRGRLPLFYSGYNSLWEAGKNYNLEKLLNGSLKDYVPNHYQLGYLVTNYGYKKYGTGFWQKVTTDATAFKGLLYPFRKAIRNYSGRPYKKFMLEALNDYKQQIKSSPVANKKNNTPVTNYYFPQIISKDSILYVKESYKKIPAFYVRDKHGEHKIKQRNISSEDWFSYRNGLIAYTAYKPNARWSLTDYSDIILLNTKTGAERKLSKKTKYFTPDISPSGNLVVAVTYNDSLQTEVHFLNSKDGTITGKIKSRQNFFLHPRFIDEENIVVLKRLSDGSISLNVVNVSTAENERITPPSFTVIGYPSVHNNIIYFTAAYEGNDDLYAYRLNDKKLFKLSSKQTGSYYANTSKDSIVWSQFTADGLQLQTDALNNMRWQEVTLPQNKKSFFSVDEGENILATDTRKFEVSRYKKATELINFHSWRPYYDAPEYTFTLYGDNILSTFFTEIFYRYNENERSHGAGFDLGYGGLFPVLTAGAEYTFNRHVNITTPQSVVPGLLNSYELRGGYYVPLDFSGGKTYKGLTFGSNYVFSNQVPVGSTKNILSTFNSSYLHHFVNWSQRLPRAVQNIFPKFGYALNNSYRHRLDENGYQAITKGELYLPSFSNHSIVLAGSFQQVDTSNVLFSNKFSLSRGYPDYYNSRMWRGSANYHLPLAYPDWGFGGIVYFLRVRSNLFYDYSRVYSKTRLSSANLRSTGAEIYFDTKWWNQLPVTFGVRYSYLLDAAKFGLNKHQWEVVIPTNLIQ